VIGDYSHAVGGADVADGNRTGVRGCTMNDNAYRDLLDTLIRKRIELRRRAQAIQADTGQILSADSAEQAVELENAEVLDELAREAIEELGKVNAALARADAGRFGLCVSCGEPIDRDRLRALPWAAHCLACATRNREPRLR
jgi:RNA polymerase-binding transcription factor DksA